MAGFELKDGKAVIPEGTDLLGLGVFGDLEGLTSVVIPKSVTKIDWQTGLSRSTATSVVVEEGNEKYDSRNNCNAIIWTETNTLLAGCSTTIIPDTVEVIGMGAFRGCSKLTEITIPNSVKRIEKYAFAFCEGLINVVIPDSVTDIDDFAFEGCKGLKSIIIPDSVHVVSYAALSQCIGLECLEIACTTYLSDTSVTSPFGRTSAPLKDCVALKSIVVKEKEGKRHYVSSNNCNAIIKTGTNTLINGSNTTIIPNSVTEIGKEAFYGRTGLSCVDIPSSVSKIGDYAFQGCTGLTNITIPESVTEIGSNAFSGCTGLTSVVIPESVNEISGGTFAYCSHLKSVVFPNSLTTIGWAAFSETALEEVAIPEQVNNMEGAFMGCKALTTVTLPKAVKKINESTFDRCTALTTINVPAKRSDFYKKRLPENLHSLIVELPAEKKVKK